MVSDEAASVGADGRGNVSRGNAKLRECVQAIVAGGGEAGSVVAAGAAQSLLLACHAGRWRVVAKALDARALARLLELATEGDAVCFVFVSLLAYAACDEYLRTCLLEGDGAAELAAVCIGLLRANEHVVSHEVLKLLAALGTGAQSRRRLSRALAEQRNVVPVLAGQLLSPPSLGYALSALRTLASTAEGCLAAGADAALVRNALRTLPALSPENERERRAIESELALLPWYKAARCETGELSL